MVGCLLHVSRFAREPTPCFISRGCAMFVGNTKNPSLLQSVFLQKWGLASAALYIGHSMSRGQLYCRDSRRKLPGLWQPETLHIPIYALCISLDESAFALEKKGAPNRWKPPCSPSSRAAYPPALENARPARESAKPVSLACQKKDVANRNNWRSMDTFKNLLIAGP